MGLGNTVLLTQVTLYLIVFVLSFFIFIPLSVNLAQFDGHCLLFADGTYNSSQQEFDVNWGQTGYCNFPIVVGIFTVPLSLFYLLWLSVYLFKDIDMSWLASFIALASCLLETLLLFVAVILLTTGFTKFCDMLHDGDIKSCEDAQFIRFEFKGEDIYKKLFFVEFGMAQFGAWCSLLCWIGLTGIASYKLYMYHRQEDFFISMRRERERLIQRVSNRTETI